MLYIHCGCVSNHMPYSLHRAISNSSLLSVWCGCVPIPNHTPYSLYREQTPFLIYYLLYRLQTVSCSSTAVDCSVTLDGNCVLMS
ncbi:hypothetical protein PDJAM_G00122240 [Pangasius djambal]|uniref:Uncharacterized protein n=1 Tax=Pangasius djambal TaxID=1691987 RepID=A0ACC5ZA80_9TELE|nr:hypothetical protein [Pangasius djambal]